MDLALLKEESVSRLQVMSVGERKDEKRRGGSQNSAPITEWGPPQTVNFTLSTFILGYRCVVLILGVHVSSSSPRIVTKGLYFRLDRIFSLPSGKSGYRCTWFVRLSFLCVVAFRMGVSVKPIHSAIPPSATTAAPQFLAEAAGLRW